MKNLHLYDFGIFLELTPDEEQQMLLENNIQQALAQASIDLEDAIDLREIKNIKLANQLLKIRRKKKAERDQRAQQENIAAQSQANIEAQNAAAQMEVRKKQFETQSEIELENVKADLESRKLLQETELKKQLMEYEFEFNLQLKYAETEVQKARDTKKEDRKDDRTKIQATQQSELIDQRQGGKPPKNFEATDLGIDLSAFGM